MPGIEEWQIPIARYCLVLGVAMLCLGIADFTVPRKVFELWKKLLSGRAFFLYGTALILAGFPLTVYRGTLSTLLFVAGIAMVLTGPVAILYPEKIRQMFDEIEAGDDARAMSALMRLEGFLVIATGLVCIAAFVLS